jgi:hypothetical protein
VERSRILIVMVYYQERQHIKKFWLMDHSWGINVAQYTALCDLSILYMSMG